MASSSLPSAVGSNLSRFRLGDLFLWTAERVLPFAHIRPQVAGRLDPVCDVTNGERLGMDLPAFHFVPRARRRYRRTRSGANGIGRCERCAVSVAARIDQDASAAVSLAEFLRETPRIA